MNAMSSWRAHPVRVAVLLGALTGLLVTLVTELRGALHGSRSAVVPLFIPVQGGAHFSVFQTAVLLIIEIVANTLVWALLFAIPVAAVAGVARAIRAMRHGAVRIQRLRRPTPEALALLEEYYEAVSVVQRDTPQGIQDLFQGRGSGMWLARLNGEAVGCVVLRRLPPSNAECKRLYVRPAARGRAIGDRLLRAMERDARMEGIEWIYLDSYDDLKTAIALYERRGYERCPPYNDNPQATLYMRKRIFDLPERT